MELAPTMRLSGSGHEDDIIIGAGDSPEWGTDDQFEESRGEEPHVSELESQWVAHFLTCLAL